MTHLVEDVGFDVHVGECWSTGWKEPSCTDAFSEAVMVYLDLHNDVVVVCQVPVEDKDVHIEDEGIDERLEALFDELAILDADEVVQWHSWWLTSRWDVHLQALRWH